jgi:hypothetical protein
MSASQNQFSLTRVASKADGAGDKQIPAPSYTIRESDRRTMLDRLLSLNHQWYEEEIKAGLHERMAGIVRENGAEYNTAQPELFGVELAQTE